MGVIQHSLESCGFAMNRIEDAQTAKKAYNLYLR